MFHSALTRKDVTVLFAWCNQAKMHRYVEREHCGLRQDCHGGRDML
jgi:hypothetical protein